ncbi:DUF6300 family protein [Streptomyces sp. NPDC087856]|uniref:DUF6300 family protein n=1 Tax=Streptomyces sp. NPDC087856 TaxID=3365811 RepID=UPI00381EC5C4
MSFTWRYLVRPDGSFSRMGNVDGSLTDEELARLRPEREDEEPSARPCSRCGTDLLLYWHGPLGTGVWMELCAACDGHRPAARAFIRWHRDTDHDPKALPRLFEDWETETMHAHGWARTEQPQASPSPPAPGSLTPRGHG